MMMSIPYESMRYASAYMLSAYNNKKTHSSIQEIEIKINFVFKAY